MNIESKRTLCWQRAALAGFAAAAMSIAAGAALAGECPAANKVADGLGQKPGPTTPKGVKDVVRATTDLSKEPLALNGRLFRLRQLDIEPGGIVPWHSHNERPAMIYVVSGQVVEYATNCTVPITHKAGDIAPERNGISHWWKNTGKKPAVLISVDLFPVANKAEEHMM